MPLALDARLSSQEALVQTSMYLYSGHVEVQLVSFGCRLRTRASLLDEVVYILGHQLYIVYSKYV